jgi:hypothetical protein
MVVTGDGMVASGDGIVSVASIVDDVIPGIP